MGHGFEKEKFEIIFEIGVSYLVQLLACTRIMIVPITQLNAPNWEEVHESLSESKQSSSVLKVLELKQKLFIGISE